MPAHALAEIVPDPSPVTGLVPDYRGPDYHGASIVNLMASIIGAFGGEAGPYAPLSGLDHAWLRAHRNIVLLVIDGLGHEWLERAGPGSALFRHTRRAITSVFPTTTASAITTFLTGLAPDEHGITGWHVYLEELGTVVAVLPFRARSGAPRAAAARFEAAAIFDHTPLPNRIPARASVSVPKRIAGSAYNQAHRGAGALRPYRSLPGAIAGLCQALRQGTGRHYAYLYHPDLDKTAHECGIDSPQARRRLAEIDAAYGSLLEGLAGTGTAVIATGDHGFIDIRPEDRIELGEHPALAELLRLPLCGDGRVAYCYVRPGRGREFERYIGTRLDREVELFASADLIAQGYFGIGTAHSKLAGRVGDYTLLMKDRYVIKDWLPGEGRFVHVGVHGGLTREELYVPLAVASV